MPQADVMPNAPWLTINVDQDVIDQACIQDSSHCMIAESVRKCYPWARNITVDVQTIRMSDPERGVRYVYLTPRQAQLALLDFDAGVKTEPFRFALTRRSAHVSWMKHRSAGKPMTEKQVAAVRENIQKARRVNPKIRVESGGDYGHSKVVTREGGKPAPLGALASGSTGRRRDDGDVPTARRRTFGLRGLSQRNGE